MQPITVSTPYKSERIHLDLVYLIIAVTLCLGDLHPPLLSLRWLDSDQRIQESRSCALDQLGDTSVVDELVITVFIKSVVRTLSPKSCCPIRGSRVGFFISQPVFTGSQRPCPNLFFTSSETVVNLAAGFDSRH